VYRVGGDGGGGGGGRLAYKMCADNDVRGKKLTKR